MRVLVAGCHRSGTTPLFNLVRTILEWDDADVYSCFADDFDAIRDFQHTHSIVKVHKYTDNCPWVTWATHIITIYREPHEVWASMKRFEVNKDRVFTPVDLGRGMAWWGMYHRHADYSANYLQLFRSTEKLAREIAEVLGIAIDEKKIVRMFRRIKPPKAGVDPVTLLHANHITKKQTR